MVFESDAVRTIDVSPEFGKGKTAFEEAIFFLEDIRESGFAFFGYLWIDDEKWLTVALDDEEAVVETNLGGG